MQLQQFRLLRWIRQLQSHFEADVIAFEVMNNRTKVLAGEMMPGSNKQEFQSLATLGLVVTHSATVDKNRSSPYGFLTGAPFQLRHQGTLRCFVDTVYVAFFCAKPCSAHGACIGPWNAFDPGGQQPAPLVLQKSGRVAITSAIHLQ